MLASLKQLSAICSSPPEFSCTHIQLWFNICAKVLDMCAAPGSKTAQLIEMIHANDGDSSSFPGIWNAYTVSTAPTTLTHSLSQLAWWWQMMRTTRDATCWSTRPRDSRAHVSWLPIMMPQSSPCSTIMMWVLVFILWSSQHMSVAWWI